MRGLAESAEHDDRAVREAPADRLQEAHAVELGHAHVGDDQRGLADPVENLQPLLSAAGLEAVEALCLEHAGEGPADTWFVIDDETVGRAGHDRRRVLGF